MKQRGRKSRAFLETFPEPTLVEPSPSRDIPAAPAHLGAQEKQIWRDVLAEFKGTHASLSLLTSGLESHMRARLCAEQIAREGMTVEGTAGQMKPHPLLLIERAAMRSFAQVFRQLGIKT